jgi:hypothetical protein
LFISPLLGFFLRTDLCPDQFGQSTDKLGRRIAIAFQRFFVDDLAYGVPEGGFEALVALQ